MFLNFCRDIDCVAVPVSRVNLCRFAAYLARKLNYTTVQQYLNVVRIIHLENGYENPLTGNFRLQAITQGIKRTKGNEPHYRLPLSPEDLLKIYSHLDLHRIVDLQFWCAVLACFFGVLRMSSVSTDSGTQGNEDCCERILCRRDLLITQKGCVLTIHHSKTNQFQERRHTVVLPVIRDNPLCPTSAFVKFLSVAGDVPVYAALLAYQSPHGLVPLTRDKFTRRMQAMFLRLGLSSADYGTHSLRRGGATWLMACGVPLHTIRVLGDWKSDCIFRYLKPSISQRFKIIDNVTTYLS